MPECMHVFGENVALDSSITFLWFQGSLRIEFYEAVLTCLFPAGGGAGVRFRQCECE